MLQDNYNLLLNYFFQNKKFPTPNRKFYELLEKYRNYSPCTHPWTVSWQILSACNLRCSHCFFAGDNSNYGTDNVLSKQDLLSLADELINTGVVSVSLSGGEILLSDALFDILKKLKNKNIAVSLQTNATLLTEKTAKRLSEMLNSYTDFVQVSLDGSNKAVYEQIRGENTFEKALNGIHLLRKNGINVNINSTLVKHNVKDIPKIFELADEMGIKKVSVSKFVPYNDFHKKLEVSFSEAIEPLAQTIKLSDNSETFLELNFRFYDFISDEKFVLWADEYIENKKIQKQVAENMSCHCHNTIYINPKGEIYLCFASECEEACLGKYPQKSLSEIWENRKNNIFFQEKSSEKCACKNCKYFQYCLGGCMGNAYKKYHSVYAPDGLCKYFPSK